MANQHQCPECNGRIVSDGKESFCTGCGLVAGTIKEANTEKSGNVRTDLQDKVTDKANGGLEKELLDDFNKAGSNLNLPKQVTDYAIKLFSDYRNKKEHGLMGKRTENVIGAAIKVACNIHENVTDDDEIASALGAYKGGIWQDYKDMIRTLKITTKLQLPPKAYVPKIVSLFGLDDVARTAAYEILEHLEGRTETISPTSRNVAVATVYLASLMRDSKKHVTQDDIYSKTGICKRTVGILAHKISDKLGLYMYLPTKF